MTMPKHDHPGYGWLAVAGVVIAADATGNRTLSELFRTSARHPVAGPFVVVGWGTLTAHLFGLIPPQYDPVHQLACRSRSCTHARIR
jgi:hypothetical protein